MNDIKKDNTPVRKIKFRQILSGISLVIIMLILQSRCVPGIDAAYRAIDRIDYLIYDMQIQANAKKLSHNKLDVVIVDIDEKSLKEQGQWPWPRNKIAKLIDSIWEQGAVVTTFDVVFAEPEKNNTQNIIDEISNTILPKETTYNFEEIIDKYNNDLILANTIKLNDEGENPDGDVVLGYIFRDSNEEDVPSIGTLPDNAIDIPESIIKSQLNEYDRYSANLEMLQKNASGGGFFSTVPDTDGIVRRYSLIAKHNDKIYPSLALETVRVFLLLEKENYLSFEGESGFISKVIINNHDMPVDETGKAIVPFIGPKKTFPYYSATDVLNKNIKEGALTDKIILIGTSAKGLMDLRSTPLDKTFPGVEVHANMVQGLIAISTGSSKEDNRFPHTPGTAVIINMVFIIILGLFLAIYLPNLSPIKLTIIVITSLIIIVVICYYYWETDNAMLAPSIPILTCLLLGSLNAGYGFLFTHRSRNKLRDRFGEYIPPDLVKEMINNPDKISNENESRNMSVLFADIRSFTTISESLTAEELKKLLNRFFTPMTYIIFDHKGTIDKYVGDMIMAFWNAPMLDPEHAQNSVLAALKMLEKLKPMQKEFLDEGLPKIDIGIGINTGTMNVGDMGSAVRRSYTVIGDAVNLGSRLEGLTKYYGEHLVISEYTYNEIKNIVCRKLDLVKVKGKTSGVTVYSPICTVEEATPELYEELERHHNGIDHYLKMDWDEAESIFTELHKEFPHTYVYELYLERVNNLRKRDLPSDWDGVFERREK